ncbi:hypothetical protein VTL71DRAFT_7584 [Oculimacula yallundae]|uniref:Cyanovirin-N domain-containing protein n=1 Tax=Oculimacula yallundae TaxID=86028 RepID=A0ABR4BVQ1_9HELO
MYASVFAMALVFIAPAPVVGDGGLGLSCENIKIDFRAPSTLSANCRTEQGRLAFDSMRLSFCVGNNDGNLQTHDYISVPLHNCIGNHGGMIACVFGTRMKEIKETLVSAPEPTLSLSFKKPSILDIIGVSISGWKFDMTSAPRLLIAP